MLASASSEISLLRLIVLIVALLGLTSMTRALPVKDIDLDARGVASSKLTHCPTFKDIETHIKAKSGGTVTNAVYYSYPRSMEQAEAQAIKLHGHSIFDYVSEVDIISWTLNCPPAVGRSILWAQASYAFALLSSGTAFVVTNTAKPEAIWTQYEFPVLQANGLVNTVLSVDPATSHKTVLKMKHSMQLPPEP